MNYASLPVPEVTYLNEEEDVSPWLETEPADLMDLPLAPKKHFMDGAIVVAFKS